VENARLSVKPGQTPRTDFFRLRRTFYTQRRRIMAENSRDKVEEEKKAEAAAKPKRPWSEQAAAAYLLTVLLVLVGQIVGMVLIFIPFLWDSAPMATASMYLQTFGTWVVGAGYMAITKKNKPILKELTPAAPGNTVPMLLIGFAVGFGMNAFCILIAWLHGDLALEFAEVNPLWLLLIFVCVFVQSSSEEMLCRGFLYQRLLRRYKKPAAAIVGNSLLFCALHLLNDGVTLLSLYNIFIVGVLFSLMVYEFDSIWCAMAAHTAWNFTQNILFGLPNSGILSPYSVFVNDHEASRSSFAYNVGFGIEATVVSAVVLTLACVVILYISQKRVQARRDAR